MSLEISMLRAGIGDCILIRCGEKEKKINILVDTGENLEVARDACSRVRKLDETINMAILTHDDNDHIKGGLMFVKSITEGKSPISLLGNISEKQLVFNYGERGKEQLLGVKQVKELVKLCGEELDFTNLEFVLADADKKDDIQYPNMIQIQWEVIESQEESVLKSEIIRGLKQSDFETEKEHAEIVILSPTTQGLKKYVAKAWRVENKERESILLGRCSSKIHTEKNEWNVPIQYWMKHDMKMGDDNRACNNASIAFLLLYKDTCTLFAGDASPDIIVENAKRYLEQIGEDKEKGINVDFIKMPHHGSSHNINKNFLDFFHTDTYLISTIGTFRYKHPGKKTLAEIAKAQDTVSEAKIFCNYGWWRKNEKFSMSEVREGKWNWEEDICNLIEEDESKRTLRFLELQNEKVKVKKNIWLGR